MISITMNKPNTFYDDRKKAIELTETVRQAMAEMYEKLGRVNYDKVVCLAVLDGIRRGEFRDFEHK